MEKFVKMDGADRVGVEGLILSSRNRGVGYRESLKLALEVSIPTLLALAYVAMLFLSAEP
jgi:hypothetical protein